MTSVESSRESHLSDADEQSGPISGGIRHVTTSQVTIHHHGMPADGKMGGIFSPLGAHYYGAHWQLVEPWRGQLLQRAAGSLPAAGGMPIIVHVLVLEAYVVGYAVMNVRHGSWVMLKCRHVSCTV
jgi:hypothetical protein